jgi:hypothetical protein
VLKKQQKVTFCKKRKNLRKPEILVLAILCGIAEITVAKREK